MTLALGYRSLADLRDNLPPEEWAIWQAYDRLCGLPADRAEWQRALQTAANMMAMGGAKKFDPVTWLPREPLEFDKPKRREQTPEEMMRAFEAMIGRQNG